MNSDKQCNGRLVIEEVSFARMLSRKVGINNETSGKISLPRDLVGKNVIVIVPRRHE